MGARGLDYIQCGILMSLGVIAYSARANSTLPLSSPPSLSPCLIAIATYHGYKRPFVQIKGSTQTTLGYLNNRFDLPQRDACQRDTNSGGVDGGNDKSS